MTPLRLYYSPGACSVVAHVALEEIGLPYEVVPVVIANGENRHAEYLAINARGRVPALMIRDEASGQVLTELLAIVTYLSRRYPDAKLLPLEGMALARALEWFSWLGSTVHQTGVRMAMRPERFTTNPEHTDSIRAQGRENVRAALADMDLRLKGRAWALGDAYSMVDVFLMVFYRWGNRIGLSVREQFPEVTRVVDVVRKRRAAQTVIEREGIELDA